MEAFCVRCAKDAKYQKTQNGEDGCPILAATFAHNVGDPEYPKEWVADDELGTNAECTAFVKED